MMAFLGSLFRKVGKGVGGIVRSPPVKKLREILGR
jgi:hypothetical protein